MKGLLPNLISEEQAAFVPGCSISEHCLLGQEIMNKFKVSKSTMGWMALKVDMEQAYDRMSWRTLEVVLMRMGFPARFCSWVLGCICNPRFSVVVNGQLSETIVAGCGFRQGATIPNVRKCLSILEDYCSWTGQRINKDKSAILFSRSTPSTTKSRLARLSGCRKVEELEYLGIRFALRRLRKADFSSLLQKIRSFTLAWGIRHLSLAGRITMINSVLLPLTVYAISHIMVPK
ncbi:uncharacterized protein LOC110099192, partial [Dendrobium catenatum]|uniref:uncharacterized protein LOC110099192 n=1 Tax=Dendrobium catenatum TaxID=906689 RepID=UPI0010A0250E